MAHSIVKDRITLEELPTSEGEYAVNVVVVPEIDSARQAKSWSDGTSCWLTSQLPKLITRPYILEFNYGLPNGDSFSWNALVSYGDTLLQCLLGKAEDLEFLKRPLIFIAHGLGGVLVKRVMSVLHEQFWELSFERLMATISGIVFLGVPHPKPGRTEDLDKLTLILRSCTGLTKRAIENIVNCLPVIASTSESFNHANTKVPVLSAFETRPTKIGRNIFSQKREILVDETLARTGVPRERMVRVDSIHNDICDLLPGTVLANSLAEFFREAETHVKPPSHAAISHGPRSFAGWTGTFSDQLDDDRGVSKASNLATFKSSGMSSFEIVDLKNGVLMQDPAPKRSKLLNLPAYLFKPHNPNPDFYGREDVLEILKEALKPSSEAQNNPNSYELKTFALCGVGGLGKTQIAIEYAYNSKNEFDAVFILQASDNGKLVQGFSDIADVLGLETAGDQVVTKDVVLGWLSAPSRKQQDSAGTVDETGLTEPRWLLVFDNADDLNVLHDFWPVTGNGSILVTSRDPLAKTRTHVPMTGGLDLQPLSITEASKWLRQLTGYTKSIDIPASEEIVNLLSGLPLAIRQIAGTISRRLISLEEFLELWNQESLRSDFYRSDIHPSPKTLWTVWAFEDLNAPSLSLLNLIAFLDPDQIPEDLLGQMSKVVHDGHPVPDDYPLGVKDFVDARTELTKSSLAKRNVERKELSIHRIIQDTTRLRMDEKTLKHTFESAIGLLHSSWPFGEFSHNTIRWQTCEPLVPHISHLHSLFQKSKTLQGIEAIWPKLAVLFMDLGWYYIERGNLNESMIILKTAEDLCKLAPESCAVTSGDVHGCLYYIAIVTNDIDSALAHCRAKISIFEKHDHRGWRLAQGHSELAESLNAAGMYEEAIQQAEIAISKYAACPEPEYADWAQMNKGRALCSLGRLEEAALVLEEYLVYREKTFGPMDTESHKTGQGLLYLGTVRDHQNRPAESLDLYLKALSQYHSTVGPQHFRVADVYHKIGTAYMKLKSFEEASFMFTRALHQYEQKVEYTAQFTRTLFTLSEIYKLVEKRELAEETLKRAHKSLKALGQQHGITISKAKLDDFIPNWSK